MGQEHNPFADETAGVAPETAVIIRSGYDKFIERISEVKDAAMAIIITDENDKKGMAEAKALRLKIKNARTEAEAKRKELKADALAYGRAVDGCYKKLEEMCLPLEEHLSLQEKYAELVAEKRRNDLIAERTAKLAPYSRVVNPATMRLGDMDEDQFQLLLAGSENRLKDELEKDRLLEIHNERQRKLRLLEPYAHLHTHTIDTVDGIENIDAYISMLREKQAEQARELAATQQKLKDEQAAREKAEATAKQAELDRVKAEEAAKQAEEAVRLAEVEREKAAAVAELAAQAIMRQKAAESLVDLEKATEHFKTTPLRFLVPETPTSELGATVAVMPDVMLAQQDNKVEETLDNYIMELRILQQKYASLNNVAALYIQVGHAIRQTLGTA
jgi:hypothetical protein